MPEDYGEPMCLLSGEPYGAEPEIKAVPAADTKTELI